MAKETDWSKHAAIAANNATCPGWKLSDSQPKARPSAERLRKLTPHGVNAAFRATQRNGSRLQREVFSPTIGHFERHELTRCQPEGGEFS
jgi:hypothetical protein